VPEDHADAPQQSMCLGCGQPVPPATLLCPACDAAGRDHALHREPWQLMRRSPWQFGLSTLFLLMSLVALTLAWLTGPSAVELRIISVGRNAGGGVDISYRVMRSAGRKGLFWGDFLPDGTPAGRLCCGLSGASDDVFTFSEHIAPLGAWTSDPPDRRGQFPCLGVAPSWQESVPLVRPGETYWVSERQPLPLLRAFDERGRLVYSWLYIGKQETASRRFVAAAATPPKSP
jgi:hypothetical protein